MLCTLLGSCENGGYRNASGLSGACVCPPGFAGDGCEAGCPGDTLGPRCEFSCPDDTLGCFGAILCVPGLYCTCAPGLGGHRCDRGEEQQCLQMGGLARAHWL